MEQQDKDQTRRRRRNRRFLDRIGDPENGFPIIHQLIERLGPVLLKYLMTNIPVWLADIENEDDDTDAIA